MTQPMRRKGRLSLTLLALALTLPLALHPFGARSANAATSPFVTRAGSTLMLNGQVFRFAGVNRYDLLSDSANPAGAQWSTAQIDQWMSEVQHMGGSVIRFWAFQRLTASGTDFSRLDYVLQDAAAHNIRVILTLENQWGDCSDGAYKTSTWYQSGYKAAYGPYPESLVSYVNQIVPRYASNPTIVAWQIMNEAEDSDFTGLYNFASDISNRIRALDPNHLISFGTIGSGQPGGSGSDYQTIHSLPNIDLLEYHDYGSDSTAVPSYLAQRMQDAVALNKPLFVGEAGIKYSIGLSQRASDFQSKMDAFFGQQKADAGYLIWSYRDAGGTSYGDGYNFLANDPLVSVLNTTASGLGTTTVSPNPSPTTTSPPSTATSTPTNSPTPAATATPATTTGNNTLEDTFAQPNQTGWGTTTNPDGVPNVAWGMDGGGAKSFVSVAGNSGVYGYPGTTNAVGIAASGNTTFNGGDALVRLSVSAVGHVTPYVVQNACADKSCYYGARLHTSQNRLELAKRSGNVTNVLSSAPFTLSANTSYWLRLDVAAGPTTTLRAKVWADGTTEPTTWLVSATDASPLPGNLTGTGGSWDQTGTGESIHYACYAFAKSALALPCR